MSLNIATGCTDTPIDGVTAPQLTLPLLNYKADYRVKSESSKEAIITNITTPLDQPESIRFGISEIANIYSKSGINTDLISGPMKGINVLTQINEVIKVTDSANAAFSQYLPMSAHLVLKIPQSGYITEAVVNTFIKRLIATLYENGVSIIPSLTRGVLLPRNL